MQRFISNLRFAHKFALIGALALLLLAVPAGLLFVELAAKLQVNQQERAGVQPIGNLLKLVQRTQQHRGQSAGFLAGQPGAARQAKAAEVDTAWTGVNTALAAMGDAALQARAASQLNTWQSLVKDVADKGVKGPQSFVRHTALVAEQLALLQAVATASGIARHNELSGFYLQHTVVSLVPRLSETMGQLRARANAVLVSGELNTESRVRLDMLVAQARQQRAELEAVLPALRQANAGQANTLQAAFAAATGPAQDVLTLAEEQIVKPETPHMAPAAFWAAMTQAIDQQFVLTDVLFAALDTDLAQTARALHVEMLSVAAAVLVLALLGGWILFSVTRSVHTSLGRAVALAQAVAGGDLTTALPPHTRDELGHLLQALAAMQSGLAQVVGSVRSNADNVATASAQIAQGNLDLSGRTEEQASALQQTAATMEQLASTVRNNADNAQQANELALGASSVAVKGGQMVGEVVATMKGINDSSRQIAEIISVIDGIAFQTNILALNAAVEAARAGEQGRGFAVVASEVRSLAQRSAEAARQIKDLITTSVQRVEQGTTLVDQAGQTMADIVNAIDRVKGIVAEISTASVEQSNGVAQVGQAVTQMDQATQRNAALVEESAAAAESLKDQAHTLVAAVSAFKLAAR